MSNHREVFPAFGEHPALTQRTPNGWTITQNHFAFDAGGTVYRFLGNFQESRREELELAIKTHNGEIAFGFSDIAFDASMKPITGCVAFYVRADIPDCDTGDFWNHEKKVLKVLSKYSKVDLASIVLSHGLPL